MEHVDRAGRDPREISFDQLPNGGTNPALAFAGSGATKVRNDAFLPRELITLEALSMMRTPALGQMTYAELCLAIENGEILVVQDGQYYEIRRRDVIRYASQVTISPDRRTALAS